MAIPADQPVDARRALPSVERVLHAIGTTTLPSPLVAGCARAAVDTARRSVEAGEAIEADDVLAAARAAVRLAERSLLQPVLNATGVLLHTNLGRATLSDEALASMAAVAGASNLEFRLDDGTRGSRHDHAGALMATLVGAEAGLVVNNNASAVMLVLATLARGRSVVVSRGELVEIGGGFRIPDVMVESGARLIEVGTTNRTRRADYERAITTDTALLLKVHASNYRMVGFTQDTRIDELADLGLPVVMDAGSGLLDEQTPWLGFRPSWLTEEPGIRQCVAAGAALTMFSGDKLLGGPQAGIIVGRRDLIDRLKLHPLARAFRSDKMTLAALQATALAYLRGEGATIPLWRMATVSLDALRSRAEAVVARVDGAKIIDTDAAAGGGTLPGITIPSVGVAIAAASSRDMLSALREHNVVAIAREGHVVCDLRSIDPRDDVRLADALAASARAVDLS